MVASLNWNCAPDGVDAAAVLSSPVESAVPAGLLSPAAEWQEVPASVVSASPVNEVFRRNFLLSMIVSLWLSQDTANPVWGGATGKN